MGVWWRTDILISGIDCTKISFHKLIPPTFKGTVFPPQLKHWTSCWHTWSGKMPRSTSMHMDTTSSSDLSEMSSMASPLTYVIRTWIGCSWKRRSEPFSINTMVLHRWRRVEYTHRADSSCFVVYSATHRLRLDPGAQVKKDAEEATLFRGRRNVAEEVGRAHFTCPKWHCEFNGHLRGRNSNFLKERAPFQKLWAKKSHDYQDKLQSPFFSSCFGPTNYHQSLDSATLFKTPIFTWCVIMQKVI